MRYDKSEIARIYREGGSTPTTHIAQTLGISKSAAAKHVQRTREAGLLPATSQGRGTPTRRLTLADVQGHATITIEEAGSLLGIGRTAAYAAARDGEIPTLRLGRRLLVPTPRLIALLSDGVEHQAAAAQP